jgi:basic membrane protein A
MRHLLSTALLLCCTLVLTGANAAFKLNGDPKIAFIMGSTAQDGGWGESHAIAARKLGEMLDTKITFTENVPEDTAKVKQVIDLYIRRGYNLIIGNSYGYSDAFLESARKYPDIAFMNAAGVTNSSNLESFYLRTYQGWYLAGIIAGSMTETNKLGMLAGFPIGLVNWDINGFMRGAQSVNPDVELAAVFANTWYDTVKEGQIAEALLEQNADVIATDLSAASAMNAAEKAGKYAVGFQIDMARHAPKGHLGSVMLLWTPYLVKSVNQMVAGTWEPSEWGAFESISAGVIDLGGVPTSKFPEGVADKVTEAKQAMIDGTLDPFSGPLYNQDGDLVVPAGEKLSDAQLWNMDYFVKGIIGTIPKSEQ